MKLSPLCLVGLLGATMLLAGCAQTSSRGRMTVSNLLHVKTTAYTGSRNAVNGCLSHGKITSAASDWSQFPLGTRFRVRSTGQIYEIDDYGSALIGTRTIDLCMTGRSAMNAWGVRWVDIDVLEWGSPRRSLEVLAPREGSRIVRRMCVALRHQTNGIPEKFHKIKM